MVSTRVWLNTVLMVRNKSVYNQRGRYPKRHFNALIILHSWPIIAIKNINTLRCSNKVRYAAGHSTSRIGEG